MGCYMGLDMSTARSPRCQHAKVNGHEWAIHEEIYGNWLGTYQTRGVPVGTHDSRRDISTQLCRINNAW